jgi:uncharacterized repeat protein (TIGR01451 family)
MSILGWGSRLRSFAQNWFLALLLGSFAALFSPHAAQAQATLVITKSVSNATPNVGDTITFTVTVSNTGPNGATGVQVTDLLPAGLTFVNSTPSQGSYNSTTGVWNVGTIANTASATLTLQTTVVSPNPQTNTVTITAETPATSVGNSASVTVTPQQADLSLAKTGSNATPNVGDTITFTVTLSNNGPNPATNVTVQDSLPAGLTFVSSTATSGTYNSTSGAWSVGTVTPGFPQALQIQAIVVSPNPQTNTASISHSDQFDPTTGNNSASATVTPQQADLAISKVVSNATPNIGDIITFTVTLSNNGPNTATNVTVQDSLPSGLHFISSTPSQGSYDTTTGVWTVGTVTTATPATLTLQATVVSSSPQTNTTSISHSDQFDPNTGNNTASATETPQGADLGLTKIVSNQTPNVGDVITFTVTLSNAGPSTATGVTVQDLLPGGLSLVSSTPSQGAYVPGSGVWTVGSVAVSATATLTIQATVTSSSPQTNAASISHSDQPDPNLSNNSASVTVTPGGADLAIAKTVSNPKPNVGDTITFTVTLSNGGSNTASNVTVQDLLPSGLQFVSATPSQGSYNSSTGVWTVGTVTTGTAQTLVVSVRVTSSSPQTNTASISHSDQPDPNTANNSASVTINPASATTTTTLVSSPNPSQFGQAVTFTATVTGTSPTGTVTFKDGAAVLGTGTLNNGHATFTTSSLTTGSHSITATYGGDANNAGSTSAALTQVVNVPADSVRLRAVQLLITKIEAQSSGAATSGAISSAIAEGLSDSGQLITPSGNGLHFNFSAEADPAPTTGGHEPDRFDPVQAARTGVLRDNGLAGTSQLPASLRAFAPDLSNPSARGDNAWARSAYADPVFTKAAPPPRAPKDWLLWADVSGTGWNTDASAGDIHGGQINAILGVTRKLRPDFLVGILGGYENFNYTSDSLNGRLKGEGWTVGGYLGWLITPAVRFDAGVARSGIAYDGISGSAAGTFPGSRWLATTGLTGQYQFWQLQIEPSARVYALWEHEDAFTDSLGTLQGANNFSTGRASGGVKVAYPWRWSATTTVTPYIGTYADYYFSNANAALLPSNNLTPPLLPTNFIQGWSARLTSGVSANFANGARVSVGGELGGLGSQNFTTWTVRGRGSLPFSPH